MESENRPHVKPGAIKYTKGYGWRLLAKRLGEVLVGLIVLAVIVSSIYILYKQPVRTSDGIVTAELTSRIHKKSDKVVVVNGDSYNILTPLLRMINEQEAYEAVIIAGPYGEVKDDGDSYRIISSGVSIDVDFDTYPGEYLDNQYVVRKLDKEGNPVNGEYDYIVNKNMILGFIK